MTKGELVRIAGRYTFAFGGGYLSTFLSLLSMAGLVLAIALLVIVLSVMNGFDKEMRERILGLVPHVTVYSHQPIADWREKADLISSHPDVESVSAFSHFDALVMHGADIETARIVGLDGSGWDSGADLAEHMAADEFTNFRDDPKGLILGVAVAKALEVSPGDSLTLLVPGLRRGDVASGARYEAVTLRAILNTGTELDQSAALVHLALASRVAGQGEAVSGLRVSTGDIFEVSRIGWELMNNLPTGYYATNWMMTHGNLYSAIQLSRDLISLLLLSIIGVAAFNVVSSLVLVVFDKRGDIAILRTLGTSPRDIALIFVLQGAMIGMVGVLIGSIVGLAGSFVVADLVAGLERLMDIQFLNTDVYPVSFLPVEILPMDIVYVGGAAFLMCILASIYPALRASKLAPAAVLHQE